MKKRIRDLLDLATTAEAAELLAGTEAPSGFKLIKTVFDGRDLEEVRLLAAKLVRAEPAVALLATRDTDAARLVFARSATLTQNMGQLIAEASQILGGRGGGRPDLAQGGGPDLKRVDEAMRLAAEKVIS